MPLCYTNTPCVDKWQCGPYIHYYINFLSKIYGVGHILYRCVACIVKMMLKSFDEENNESFIRKYKKILGAAIVVCSFGCVCVWVNICQRRLMKLRSPLWNWRTNCTWTISVVGCDLPVFATAPVNSSGYQPDYRFKIIILQYNIIDRWLKTRCLASLTLEYCSGAIRF